MKSSMLFDTVDLVVPVPSHKKRMKKRGYNQVLSFAQAIANVLEVPCNNLVLMMDVIVFYSDSTILIIEMMKKLRAKSLIKIEMHPPNQVLYQVPFEFLKFNPI